MSVETACGGLAQWAASAWYIRPSCQSSLVVGGGGVSIGVDGGVSVGTCFDGDRGDGLGELLDDWRRDGAYDFVLQVLAELAAHLVEGDEAADASILCTSAPSVRA